MGSQQTTNTNQQSNLQFDPQSLSTYQKLIGGGGNVLSQYINDPFGNAMYKFGQSASQAGAQQLGNQNMQMLNQLMRTSGFGGQAGAGFLGAQQARTGRANQAMRSQANLSNIQSALARQMGATGMGMSFSPLMTGQTSKGSQTTSTSGAGTWLPQVIGAGLGAAMMGMGSMGGAGGGMPFMSGGAPTAMQGVTGVAPGSSMFAGFPSAAFSNMPSSMPTFIPPSL